MMIASHVHRIVGVFALIFFFARLSSPVLAADSDTLTIFGRLSFDWNGYAGKVHVVRQGATIAIEGTPAIGHPRLFRSTADANGIYIIKDAPRKLKYRIHSVEFPGTKYNIPFAPATATPNESTRVLNLPEHRYYVDKEGKLYFRYIVLHGDAYEAKPSGKGPSYQVTKVEVPDWAFDDIALTLTYVSLKPLATAIAQEALWPVHRLHGEKKYEDAIILARSIGTKLPNNPVISDAISKSYHSLADLHHLTDIQKAIEYQELAVQNGPRRVFTIKRLADFYARAGMFARGEALWKEKLVEFEGQDVGEDSFSPLYYAAMFYEDNGHFDKALPLWEQNYTTKPDWHSARYLSTAYLSAGREDDATRLWEAIVGKAGVHQLLLLEASSYFQTVGQFRRALSLTERALPSSPQNEFVYRHYARVLALAGDIEKAKRVYLSKMDQFTSAHKYLYYATFLDELGQHSEAVHYRRLFYEDKPDDFSRQVSLSFALIKANQYDEARDFIIARFKDGTRNKWDRAILTLIAGNRISGRHDEAWRLLSQFYGPGPTEANGEVSALEFARRAVAAGDKQKAIGILEKWVSYREAILARADKAFSPLWDDDKFQAATDPVQVATRHAARYARDARENPRQLKPIVERVRHLRRAGRIDDGLREVAHALRTVSTFSDRHEWEVWLYDEKAHLHSGKGEFDQAKAAWLDGIAKVGPWNPNAVVNILIHCSLFLIDNNENEEAIKYARRALYTGVTDYGKMLVLRVVAEASHKLNETQKRDQAISAMARLTGLEPVSMAQVYLLVGDRSKAVDTIVTALGDPVNADRVLVRLQKYKVAHRTPESDYRYRDLHILRNSDEVQRAVGNLGRMITFDVIQPPW